MLEVLGYIILTPVALVAATFIVCVAIGIGKAIKQGFKK